MGKYWNVSINVGSGWGLSSNGSYVFKCLKLQHYIECWKECVKCYNYLIVKIADTSGQTKTRKFCLASQIKF